MITRVFLNLFCIASCFNVFFSSAQSFQRLFGTAKNDNFSSMLLLSNGDYIVTGTTVGFGSDIYVARVNNSGSIIWENTYGGARNEDNSVSCINNNGNIVIAASSSSYNAKGNLDILIFEITTNGRLNWSRNYGQNSTTLNSDEIPRKLNLSNSGLVLCATIGTPGSLSPDALALEISSNGQSINWQNQIGIDGGYGDIPSSIVSNQLGMYVMVGGSYTLERNYDQVVWRLNANGSLRSNMAFGSVNNENAHDVIILPNNDIVVMGNFRNLSGTGLEFALSSIRLNNTFNWIKTYGDNSIKDERAYGFTRTTDGYAFSGYTNGKNNNDVLLVRTNNQGKLLESISIGDTGKEESSAIIQNSDESFTIAGVSSSSGAGLDDSYLVRTNNGRVDNNCSSYNILERTITTNIFTDIYSESNPQLSNTIISLSVVPAALSVADLVCSTLPLELVDFEAYFNDNSHRLKWISLNEVNLSHFEIEKSYDGNNWEFIDEIKSQGSLNVKKTYNYIDVQTENDCSYFRLKQVDNDGKYSYSRVIKSCSSLNNVFIYPNPTKRFLSITGLVLDKEILLNISIKNLQGLEIYKENFKNNHLLESDFLIDLENVDSGIYILSIISENKVFSARMNKE